MAAAGWWRSRRVATSCASARRTSRPAAAGREHRPAHARSLLATRRSAARPPTACAGRSSTTTADGPVGRSVGSPSSRRHWRSTRWPTIRSASRSCGPRGAIERFERDQQRTERRVRGRSESLARQFDRVLRVLEAWGYVDGWQLTETGEQLARLYTETDLLLAEALREELLDGLRPPELAAVVSCFTYERRGPEGQNPMPPARWPTKTVAEAGRARSSASPRTCAPTRTTPACPRRALPDPGFTPFVYDWAAGDSLADVLDDDEMTGGDFVRHVKQCIDLLRQVGEVAADPETRARAREAADACHRGVVAASSVAGT